MKLPSMLRHLPFFCLSLVSVASFAGSEKSPGKNAVTIDPVHPMYLGSINTGLKGNDAYTEGNFSIVAPVWSSLGRDAILDGGLFYIEPYISWGEGGEVATSLGFGYRHLIGRQPLKALTDHDGHQAPFWEEGVVLGGNLFLDMLDTETNHQFWQLGVGAEILTRYVELRGNYYIPLTDKKEVGTVRTQESFQSTSEQTSIVGADPYATNNSILQPYTEVTTQTTTTTTIERLFRQYEEGMEGWDFEIGILLPWVDRYMDAKIIAGYYAFDNQPFGPQTGGAGNVEGWKTGFEVRPVPALVLSGTWYEDERLTGGDWTASIRMEIPFEAGDLNDGKSFWSRIGDSFKPRRRHLVERMAEPVRRQNAAVKTAKTTEEDESEKETSVKKVTKVVSQSQGQLVLADDVVFVNDGPAVGNGIQAGSPTGDGTAAKPVLTIQEGADLAGPRSTTTGRVWSVYTQGVTNPYTEDVTVSGSTNFISSGKGIVGLSGRSFGMGPQPVLDGGILANSVGTLGVTGYFIDGGSSLTGHGIEAIDVNRVLLDSNTFSFVGGDGVLVASTGTTKSTVVLTANEFMDAAVHAIHVESDDFSEMTFTASGNSISGTGDESLFLFANDNSTFNALVRGNAISDTNGDGISAGPWDDASMTIRVTGNDFSFIGERGVEIGNEGDSPASVLTAIVTNNRFFGTFLEAVALANLDSGTLYGTVAGNSISGAVFADGISLAATGNLTSVSIRGNSIQSTGLGGIYVESLASTDLRLSITGNYIAFTTDEGIYLDLADSVVVATVSGNTLETLGAQGIHVDAALGSDVTLAVDRNRVTESFDEGIGLHSLVDSDLKVTSLTGNTISLADFHGIDFYVDDATASLIVGQFNSNVILDPTDNGINIESVLGSTLEINGTSNNRVTGQGGLPVDSSGASAPTGSFLLNNGVITLP